ncbi:MAG: hypothetical protein AAB701_02000 [Patescibacteria group bacterium]
MNVAVEIRDNEWLQDQLAHLWYRHFSDIEQPNDVVITFGRPAAARLGSIKWGRKPVKHHDGTTQRRSIITITSYFKDLTIPEQVIQAVIAHELAHYAHGFSSPLYQKFNHPHKGGVVDKELKIRGLGETLAFQKKWMKTHWVNYIRSKR